MEKESEFFFRQSVLLQGGGKYSGRYVLRSNLPLDATGAPKIHSLKEDISVYCTVVHVIGWAYVVWDMMRVMRVMVAVKLLFSYLCFYCYWRIMFHQKPIVVFKEDFVCSQIITS